MDTRKTKFLSIALSFILLAGCGGGGGSSHDSSTSSYSSSSTPSVIIGFSPRPKNPTCLAGEAPGAAIKLTQIYSSLSLTMPVAMVQVPGNINNPFYIAERSGKILYVPANTSSGNKDATVALTLNAFWEPEDESGIAALAFHPNYATNGLVYITYVAKVVPGPLELRLSEFHRAADGIHFENERVLMRIHKDNPIHHSGALAFGPEGYLYMSVGDDNNNSEGDPHVLLAKDPTNVYGKILRLDVDHVTAPLAYAIPSDNPNLTGKGPNEVWALGFRNPWRMTFDRQAPYALWSSNVGNLKKEEINVVEKGKNYGWPSCEGSCSPTNPNFTDPIYEYYHTQGGAAVIGGYVYRGTAIPDLVGKYIFGDFVTSDIWALDQTLPKTDLLYVTSLLQAKMDFADFAQDNSGELYVIGYSTGTIHKIEKGDNAGKVKPPQLLSQTGCFASVTGGITVPNEGVIAYDVAQRFWSDGAEKSRYIAIPDGTKIDVANPDDWILPPGGVTIKNFSLANKVFETRLFVRYNDGTYGGYTYEWKDDLSDATLVPYAGKDKNIAGQKWHYPSQGECLRCHNNQVNGTLSLESRQLNVMHEYAATKITANQIDTFAANGMLSTTVPAKLDPYPSVDKLSDNSISLDLRARSYLQVNCSSCHHDTLGVGRAHWSASFNTPFEKRGLCNKTPFEFVNTVGSTNEKLIAPGNHALSTLWLRASLRDSAYAMPPLGSNVVDKLGADLLSNWIDGMGSACPSTPVGASLPATIQAGNYDRVSDQDTADTCHLDWNAGACFPVSSVGPWFEYDFNTPKEKDVDINLRVTTTIETMWGSRYVSLAVDDVIVAKSIKVIDVGDAGWQVFNNHPIRGIHLTAGNHVVRVIFDNGGTNFQSIEIK